jgi:hypothetical protein
LFFSYLLLTKANDDGDRKSDCFRSLLFVVEFSETTCYNEIKVMDLQNLQSLYKLFLNVCEYVHRETPHRQNLRGVFLLL